MLNETPFVESEWCQVTKDGQSACGDDFKCERFDDEHRHIAVLSDGLGSGIKANLLATMTTTMALKFMMSNMDILKSAETIMDALPVCDVRQISYATFTIVDMLSTIGNCRIIEMGNPDYILLRDDLEIPPFSSNTLISERWPDRDMKISETQMLLGDRLIFSSDGVSQAGLGTPGYKFGWRKEGCMEFAQELIRKNPAISAKDLSRSIVFKALSLNPNRRCVDDTSCVVIYLRKPRKLRIITGPPYHKSNDTRFAEMAKLGVDNVIICGGTTSNIIQRELNTSVKIDLRLINPNDELPPPGMMKGIGLTTEGILTLTKTSAYLEAHRWTNAPIAVKEIISRLENSDEIEFIVGTKVNEAHQDPSLPLDLEIRRNIIKRIKDILENDYRKRVTIEYI